MFKLNLSLFILLIIFSPAISQNRIEGHISDVAYGYAKSSVNATVFRKNSISSYKDHQYVAFYDNDAYVMLAKRKLGSDSWKINKTQYKGNVKDAHNVICIMHDGNGLLHMSWDHHNDPLRYAVSVEPESIAMGEKQSMVGELEDKATYPEFYKMANGDLIFLYRDGSSGNGNLVMNHYDLNTKSWHRVHNNLIDGEGERNAYWQMCIDKRGTIHLSWVWRETGDVATNHDMCYARSMDNGLSWETSTGRSYNMPINAQSAEYVMRIPQKSNLINQTSMTADGNGNPYIATYFQSESDAFTQFKVIYKLKGEWKTSTVSERKTDFKLGGGGTRSIPISRPQIVYHQQTNMLYVIYRDEEKGNKACIASTKVSDMKTWKIDTITNYSMKRWEPSYDTELWKNRQLLHVYYQVTQQGNSETIVNMLPTKVGVMEVHLE